MDDQLRLRPVVEEDLAVIERLTGDPELAGEHGWHGRDGMIYSVLREDGEPGADVTALRPSQTGPRRDG